MMELFSLCTWARRIDYLFFFLNKRPKRIQLGCEQQIVSNSALEFRKQRSCFYFEIISQKRSETDAMA